MPFKGSFRARKHYEAEVIIPVENLLEMGEENEFDEWYPGNYRIQQPLVPNSTSYTFKSKAFKVVERPGEKLQALIDLGYTEKEGVRMLDALGEESEGE